MGVATFLLVSLINTIPSLFEGMLIYMIPYWLMLVLSFIVAVVWELMENTLFVDIGIKFEGRRDSFLNATWDVIFVCLGSLIMWIIKGVMVNMVGVHLIPAYYILGIIGFMIVIIAFLIGKAITK